MTLGSGAACHKSLLTFLGWTAKPSGNATDCSVITQSYQCVLFTVIWWTSRILNFSFQIVSSLVFTEVWHQKPSLLSGLHWVLPEISLKIRGLGSLTRQLRYYHTRDCSYIYRWKPTLDCKAFAIALYMEDTCTRQVWEQIWRKEIKFAKTKYSLFKFYPSHGMYPWPVYMIVLSTWKLLVFLTFLYQAWLLVELISPFDAMVQNVFLA